MAMVKLDSVITELEGTEGGTVFRKDVCGQHAQAPPRTTKGRTPAQIRQSKSFLRALYHCSGDIWTDEAYEKWKVYCANHPIVNSKGESQFLSPFLACMRINTIRARNDLELVDTPPE